MRLMLRRAANGQTTVPPAESTTPGYPDNAYVITDYYNEDGTFSGLGLALDEVNSEKTLILNDGDIFVVGGQMYIVTAETLTLSFYTQSSLADVNQWWTNFAKLWEWTGCIRKQPPKTKNELKDSRQIV